ncbi:AraC family transcriptional regulator [Lichenihabitans sp. Uapishka_5]|uniref:helix-turn-helix domain-containing protein n=1 Tax=Lichenihabitans sp. Uapishka_5 TaxID=3037302 RepID=UPI0029E825B8|nr:AraC family transcriptional regulator [Lichenihabitans sp. Uapishka_5]MDX7951859.1 AraC family transcriptional regulator [Lichenihabitans sp. Uapishka_5]
MADFPRSRIGGAFDALQFYVPEVLFDELAQEDGLSRPRRLRWRRDEPDPVAASLGALLLPALDDPAEWRTMYVEHIALAFLSHAALRYGDGRAAGPAEHGGLAPWQERRAKEMMRASLGTRLTMTEVSRACRLSTTYFAAAFRRSTGCAPHRFFSEMRVEEAKRLMLATNLPLADVALLCGFGDQSHFTRVFSKIGGMSPGIWQRMNRIQRFLAPSDANTR